MSCALVQMLSGRWDADVSGHVFPLLTFEHLTSPVFKRGSCFSNNRATQTPDLPCTYQNGGSSRYHQWYPPLVIASGTPPHPIRAFLEQRGVVAVVLYSYWHTLACIKELT